MTETKKEILKIDEIELRLWKNDSDEVLVIVGGDGDTNKTFIRLVEELYEKGFKSDVVTISFRKGKENITPSLKAQMEDLFEVLNFLQSKNYSSINILCTSNGAYSTAKVLGSNMFNNVLLNVVFLDPADYYLSSESSDEPDFIMSDRTWGHIQALITSNITKMT